MNIVISQSVSKIPQQVKAYCYCDNLSSIPRSHIEEGTNQFLQVVL